MVNEHDIELVESYLEGNLQGEELEAFLERQKSDPEFAQFIQVRMMIGDAWTGAADYLEAKKWVSDTIHEHVRNKSRFNRNILWYSLAALILVFIGIFVILEFSSRGIDDQPTLASDTTLIELELNKTGPQDHKASIDSAFIEAVLITPVNNEVYSVTDSLNLIWEFTGFEYKELNICLSINDSSVFTILLEARQTEYLLRSGILMPGTYYWYLDKPVTKGDFEIISEK